MTMEPPKVYSGSGDPLLASLLDLLYELRNTDIRLTLAGGYGLYLKHMCVAQSRQRVLISDIPPARSTSDLDIFLQTELFAHPRELRLVREALNQLGYIPKAPNWQFVMPDSGIARLKIDLHARTPDPDAYPDLKNDSVRVKPTESVGLHGRHTPEAVTIEEFPLEIIVSGSLANSESFQAPIYLPHAHPFLMMKLHAFRDQELEGRLDFARKHAIDVYTITALMTEVEYETCKKLSISYADHPAIISAAEIVRQYFSDDKSIGVIRFMEDGFHPRESDIEMFLRALTETLL